MRSPRIERHGRPLSKSWESSQQRSYKRSSGLSFDTIQRSTWKHRVDARARWDAHRPRRRTRARGGSGAPSSRRAARQGGGPREIVLASTVGNADALATASAHLRTLREELTARGVDGRAAAFTSVMPGADLSRLAVDQEAELVLVDAPDRLLEDTRLLTLLEDAPCDVAVLVDGDTAGEAVIVPFAGAEHDWSAVELGAWFALGAGKPLRLAGASSGFERSGREPSPGQRVPRRPARVWRRRRADARRAGTGVAR